MTVEQKRMSQMSDTVDNLLLYDPVMLDGEIILEQDSNQMKIGTAAAEKYSQLDYFNPSTLKETIVTSATLSTSAALCGSLVRVQNASSFTLTLLSGDLSQPDTPVGITSHFPKGGFFYVMFDQLTSALTTFTVTAGPNNTFWANEFGQAVSKSASTSLSMNGSSSCHGKMYLFLCLSAGVWQVYEIDLKDVWVEAKVTLLAYPSYGGGFRRTPAPLGNGKTIVTLDGAMASNSGVDTTDFLNGNMTVKTAGDYWIKGTVTVLTSTITPTIFLRILKNSLVTLGGVLEYGGTWPSSFTPMTVDLVIRCEVNDVISLELEGQGGGGVDVNLVQFSQLILQKMDIRTAT